MTKNNSLYRPLKVTLNWGLMPVCSMNSRHKIAEKARYNSLLKINEQKETMDTCVYKIPFIMQQ